MSDHETQSDDEAESQENSEGESSCEETPDGRRRRRVRHDDEDDNKHEEYVSESETGGDVIDRNESDEDTDESTESAEPLHNEHNNIKVKVVVDRRKRTEGKAELDAEDEEENILLRPNTTGTEFDRGDDEVDEARKPKEDKKVIDPMAVPTQGKFYLHDDRCSKGGT